MTYLQILSGIQFKSLLFNCVFQYGDDYNCQLGPNGIGVTSLSVIDWFDNYFKVATNLGPFTIFYSTCNPL